MGLRSSINYNEYPTCEKLYQDKNKKYFFPWFISFTVFLAVIVIIQLASLIQFAVTKDAYINNMVNTFNLNNPSSPVTTDVGAEAYKQGLIYSIMTTIILTGIFVWHLYSFIKCYLKQNYIYYSPVLQMIYFFAIVFQGFNLFWGLSKFMIYPWDIKKILTTTNVIIFIIIYVAVYLKCAFIIRVFRQINFRNEQMAAQSGNNNAIFNSMFQGFMNNTPQNSNNNNNNPVAPEQAQTDTVFGAMATQGQYAQKLTMLDHQQLIKFAEKLNIYGAKDFTKEELIEKISQVFEEKTNQGAKFQPEEQQVEEIKELKKDEDKTDD